MIKVPVFKTGSSMIISKDYKAYYVKPRNLHIHVFTNAVPSPHRTSASWSDCCESAS